MIPGKTFFEMNRRLNSGLILTAEKGTILSADGSLSMPVFEIHKKCKIETKTNMC